MLVRSSCGHLKLQRGSFFAEWLLDARTQSEQSFVQVVTEAYVRGISTRKVETLGVTSLSKSQVSELAQEAGPDRLRVPQSGPYTGPYTYAWADDLVVRCREGGRVVNVALLLAVGMNDEGHLGNIGPRCRYGRGRGRLARACGAASSLGAWPVCSSVCSDDHPGLRDAIAPTLPGVSWQRCRTHYLRNLLTKVPRTAETVMDHHGQNHLRPTRPRIRMGLAPPCSRPPSRPRYGHRS